MCIIFKEIYRTHVLKTCSQQWRGADENRPLTNGWKKEAEEMGITKRDVVMMQNAVWCVHLYPAMDFKCFNIMSGRQNNINQKKNFCWTIRLKAFFQCLPYHTQTHIGIKFVPKIERIMPVRVYVSEFYCCFFYCWDKLIFVGCEMAPKWMVPIAVDCPLF